MLYKCLMEQYLLLRALSFSSLGEPGTSDQVYVPCAKMLILTCNSTCSMRYFPAKKCRRVFLVALVLVGLMMVYSFATSISCHLQLAGCAQDNDVRLFGQRLDFVDARRASE